jgi:hypothetical protein
MPSNPRSGVVAGERSLAMGSNSLSLVPSSPSRRGNVCNNNEDSLATCRLQAQRQPGTFACTPLRRRLGMPAIRTTCVTKAFPPPPRGYRWPCRPCRAAAHPGIRPSRAPPASPHHLRAGALNCGKQRFLARHGRRPGPRRQPNGDTGHRLGGGQIARRPCSASVGRAATACSVGSMRRRPPNSRTRKLEQQRRASCLRATTTTADTLTSAEGRKCSSGR